MTAQIARSWPGRGPDARESRLSLSHPRQRVVVREPPGGRPTTSGRPDWRALRARCPFARPPPPPVEHCLRGAGVPGRGAGRRRGRRPVAPPLWSRDDRSAACRGARGAGTRCAAAPLQSSVCRRCLSRAGHRVAGAKLLWRVSGIMKRNVTILNILHFDRPDSVLCTARPRGAETSPAYNIQDVFHEMFYQVLCNCASHLLGAPLRHPRRV